MPDEQFERMLWERLTAQPASELYPDDLKGGVPDSTVNDPVEIFPSDFPEEFKDLVRPGPEQAEKQIEQFQTGQFDTTPGPIYEGLSEELGPQIQDMRQEVLRQAQEYVDDAILMLQRRQEV